MGFLDLPNLDDTQLSTAVGGTKTAAALAGTYARANRFDAERYKTATNTDLQAIQAALAAATNAGSGNVVALSGRTWDVGNGLSMSGYSCALIGVSAGHSSANPTGTVLYASTQTGPVLDFTGYVFPDSFRGRMPFGQFALRGSNVADATKANAGLKIADNINAAGSMLFSDIAISQTGGPCLKLGRAYLSDFDRITLVTPVNAKANDVPYLLAEGANANRFRGIGLRSITASADVGPSGAIVVKATSDNLYPSYGNVFDACWFEYLHIPTNGCLISSAGNTNVFRDFSYSDVSIETGATGTAVIRLAPSAVQDQGGNIVDGYIPGSQYAATGISVTQSRNLIRGVRGYNGNNVVLQTGVNYNVVTIEGGESGVAGASVVDNSGTLTNLITDSYNLSYKSGSWQWVSKGSADGAAGPQIQDPATPANGSIWLGNAGARLQAVGGAGYQTGDSFYFRDLALNPLGQVDKFAGWQLRGAIELFNPATQTTAPVAGAGAALPATPAGYVKIRIAGTDRFLPYY